MNKEIKRLEAKKKKIEKEEIDIQDKIDLLVNEQMKEDFKKLKQNVEDFNKRYDNDFIECLRDACKKEDEDELP